jgi:hypothetical protein
MWASGAAVSMIPQGVSTLNIEVEKRGETDRKITTSFNMRIKKFVREISGSCVNSKKANHYTSRTRDRLLQPAAGCIINLAITPKHQQRPKQNHGAVPCHAPFAWRRPIGRIKATQREQSVADPFPSS